MNMKEVFRSIVFLFISCLLIPGVLAGFDYQNNNLKSVYVGGETLQGSVTLALNEMPAHSVITSNLGGNMTLIDFLAMHGDFTEGVNYNCSTLHCLRDYKKTSANSISSLTLDGNRKIVGFHIESGHDINIVEVGFEITSNSERSCVRDLLIDVSNSADAFLQSDKYVVEACDPMRRGCFNDGLSGYDDAILGSTTYCNKINLPPAPAYEIGAKVKNSTSGRAELEMELFSIDGAVNYGHCKLPTHTQEDESLSCIVNYTGTSAKDYLVCVSAPGGGGSYMVRYEQSGDVCGTDDMGTTFEKDYEVFAQTMKFDYAIINVGETLFTKINSQSIITYLNDYMYGAYGNDCDDVGCFIPFELTGKSQNLLFNNPKMIYKKGSTSSQSTRIFQLGEDDAVVSSGNLTLDVEKLGIVLPLQTNEDKLRLYISGVPIISSGVPISITSGFSFDIVPKFVLIGAPTEFVAVISSNKSISSGSWKFGDGQTKSSSDEKITHTYSGPGTYELEVTLNAVGGAIAKKTFSILVGDPKSSAESLLERYNQRINNVEGNLSKFPPWVSESIKNKIDVVSLKAVLTKFNNQYEVAASDSDYTEIINKLIDLKIPTNVVYSETGKFPLIIGLDKVDVTYLEEVIGKNIDDVLLKQNIIDWVSQNYAGNIESDVISLFTDSNKEDIATAFNVVLDTNGNIRGSVYLFIDYPFDAIAFKQNYGQKEVESGTYVPLKGTDESFEFIIQGDVSAAQLGIYPASGQVFSVSNEVEPSEEPFKFGGFLMWLIVVIVVIVVTYLVLQTWYKSRYERFLFPKKDDLYNLISFINNSRVAKLADDSIKVNLRRVKWGGEHISYAFKKLDGVKVSMWEVPIFKIFENRKVKSEIGKRQGLAFAPTRPPSATFIKRSGLK